MSQATPSGVFNVLFFTGKSTVFLQSGDQLFGTGAMPQGRGQIRLRGEFNPAEGTTTGVYLGSVCSA